MRLHTITNEMLLEAQQSERSTKSRNAVTGELSKSLKAVFSEHLAMVMTETNSVNRKGL